MGKRGYWILSVVVVLVVAGAIAVASNAKPNPFPLAVYPAANGDCPNLSAVTKPNPASAPAKTLKAFAKRGSTTSSGYKVSDRAYWPRIPHGFAQQTYFVVADAADSLPAADSAGAGAITAECGAKVLADSWALIDSMTGKPTTTYYFIQRHGIYLIWKSIP